MYTMRLTMNCWCLPLNKIIITFLKKIDHTFPTWFEIQSPIFSTYLLFSYVLERVFLFAFFRIYQAIIFAR